MDRAGFHDLAGAGYNAIPLMRELLLDQETPLGTYLRVADKPWTYLFESVCSGEKWGRYSIIGLPAEKIYKFYGRQLYIEQPGEKTIQRQCDNPLLEVRRLQQSHRVPEIAKMPRFCGGLVGYFGYDTITWIEPRITTAHLEDPLDTPDILLMQSTELMVYDNLMSRLYLIVHVDPARENAWQKGQQRLDELTEQLLTTPARPPSIRILHQTATAEADFHTSFGQTNFEDAVRKIKEYIAAGDVMQTVLSQRLSIDFPYSPTDLYSALRCLNPSPYMYCLHLQDFHIVGSSPEILVRLEEDSVTVRPIAGTRPRSVDKEKDQILAEELMSDPKELAEHVMLIDLGRNDISRVCDSGSVHLTERMLIERYSHVMHIVSNVCGTLCAGKDAVDVLSASFPAGTVSGAPKIRAMEIIAELEPVKRGVYSGAIGYLDWGGNMDTAIAIRTAIIKEGMLYLQVGCGVVADSEPRKEWEETLNKGRAMFRAVGMVAAGKRIAAEGAM